jgi:hypothetical protein
MLTAREERLLLGKAYIPEHLPYYGSAVSGMEPSMYQGYLYYRSKEQLNLVGYPLDRDSDPGRLRKVLEHLLDKHSPPRAAVIAPELPDLDLAQEAVTARSSDVYLLLETKKIEYGKKLRSLLRRAARELHVRSGACGREHEALIIEFLQHRNIEEEHGYIFREIPEYLRSSKNAVLLEARRGDELVAFEVVDFSREYGFYMFNFLSRRRYVPGASDLLLQKFIQMTEDRGLNRINMGLRINQGIARFKEKWGAEPWLNQEYISFNQDLARLMRLSRSMGI